MKYIIVFSLLYLGFFICLNGQSRKELEDKRNKTLDEIVYVDNLLKTTSKQKMESMTTIKIIGNKLVLRETVIKGMKEEIQLLMDRIDLNEVAIGMMESDLIILRNDYEKAVINSYRTKKGTPELVYLLSAKDFNQGYKRLKYLQQIAKFRRKESEIILVLKNQIETSKARLKSDLYHISELKRGEEEQKGLLQNEQEKRQKMVKSLTKKEIKLKNELEEKKKIALKIEKEIGRILEEERKKSIRADNTPEQKLIGENFVVNKGRLPWPVEKGIITSHFGIHKNAVLKNVEENNINIEITSYGKVTARSVFQGEVAGIFPISGENMTIMIRHGRYFSVYTNIVNIKVKKGDKILTKEEIGDVYSDPGNGNNCVLKFMIFETNAKYLDPEDWIAKK